MTPNAINDYLESFKLITNTQNIIAYVTNKHNQLLAVSCRFKEIFNLGEAEETSLYSLNDVNKNASSFFYKFKATLIEQELLVIKNKLHHVFLQVINQFSSSKLYIVHKFPVIIDSNVEAIYTCMLPYGFPRIPDLTFITFNTNYYARPLTSEHKLTEKQHLILFFLIRNHSYAEISSWMSAFGHTISVARVNEHIINLKNIFNVNSRIELIDKALEKGYYSEVPLGLLQEGSYLIDDFLFRLSVVQDYSTPLATPEYIKPTTPRGNLIIYQPQTLRINHDIANYLDKVSQFYFYLDTATYFFDNKNTLIAQTASCINLGLGSHEGELLQEIIKIPSKTNSKHLQVININNSVKIFIAYKHVILNESEQIIGYSISISPYIMPSIPLVMEKVFNVVKLPYDLVPKDVVFTKKQLFVIYFYIRNFWNQRISQILSEIGFKISPSRVSEHLANIKSKLKVSGKSHLLDRAIAMNHHIIPRELIRTGVFNIDNTEIDKWIC